MFCFIYSVDQAPFQSVLSFETFINIKRILVNPALIQYIESVGLSMSKILKFLYLPMDF